MKQYEYEGWCEQCGKVTPHVVGMCTACRSGSARRGGGRSGHQSVRQSGQDDRSDRRPEIQEHQSTSVLEQYSSGPETRPRASTRSSHRIGVLGQEPARRLGSHASTGLRNRAQLESLATIELFKLSMRSLGAFSRLPQTSFPSRTPFRASHTGRAFSGP
jgi:hypothetical protein